MKNVWKIVSLCVAILGLLCSLIALCNSLYRMLVQPVQLEDEDDCTLDWSI